MKLDESLEDFSNRILHLYYEIPGKHLNWGFLKQDFDHLVLVSSYGEPEPPNFSTPPTLVNHETPQILEEFTSPFILCPPPFLVLMRVPPCSGCKTGKFTNQISNPSSHSSSTLHDSDSMEEISECLMKPIVKTRSSISQDDVTVHNSSLKANADFCYPISSTYPNYLYHDLLD